MKQCHISKITDLELLEVYEKTPHLGKIAHELRLPVITIWRRLKKLGKSCNSPKNNNKIIPLDEILEGLHPHYQTFKLNKRLLKEGIFENVCSVCGISDWNGQSLSMQLDHINGISSDHKIDNLRLICPNCHSQTPTFCGKNK